MPEHKTGFLADRAMYAHQMDGARTWATKFHCRGILAHDPGTGKTSTSIYIAEHLKGTGGRPLGRIIVICPEHLRINWKREFQQFTDRPIIVITAGTDRSTALQEFHNLPNAVLIMGYTMATREGFIGSFRQTGPWRPDLLICDECHYLKTNTTKRTKGVRKLVKFIPAVLMLSGTPVVAKPAELFPVLNMLRPDVWDNFMGYARRYCNAKKGPFGWMFDGSSHLDELHQILSKLVMHRAKKEDCLDLPPKQRVLVPLPITNRPEYVRVEAGADDMWTNVTGEKEAINVSDIARISQIRRCAVAGKIDATKTWLTDFLEENPKEKLLIFCHHKETVGVIKTFLDEAKINTVLITGDETQKQRQTHVDMFQTNPDVRVALATIAAGSTGLTLTAASNVVFVETDWTPGVMIQAEDRLHRIGQKDHVTCWYLVAEDTIDEQLVRVILKKQSVVERVLDGAAKTPESETSVMADLFSQMGQIKRKKKDVVKG
ncbi:DEAD/DEAH box helicase [bacterium]|nr:DEAD/DEAH box helicase [bacterium]